MLNPGQEVGAYIVEALTGSGGTAVVYRVRHHAKGTKHALKVLSVTSESIRDRMTQEGQVQASLHHTNVVAVTDVIDVFGDPGLVMEFVEGPALDEAMLQYRLDPRASEALFLGILAGVKHAHAFGLVHRDLKPANVLLARTPAGFVPKVTDFGLAKVLDQDHADVGRTRAGVAMGTPAYMAPEQIRDARAVDQRADIFSLGCLLYELFTQTRAFPGQQALAVYNAVIDGAYTPPRELVPTLDPRVENAIHGCLILERADRIPDCDTLARVLRGEIRWNIPDHPDTEDFEPDPTTSTVPLDAPALLVAGIEDSGTLTVVSPMKRAAPVAAPHPRAARGTPWWLWGVGAALALALVTLPFGGAALWGAHALWGQPPEETPSLSIEAVMEPAEISEKPDHLPELPATPPGAVAPATVTLAPASEAPAPLPAEESPPPTLPAAPPPAKRPAPPPSAYTKGPLAIAKILSVPPTAEILVDGEAHGRTPGKLALSEGFHAIELRADGKVGVFSLRVEPEGANKWCYDFANARTYEGACPR